MLMDTDIARQFDRLPPHSIESEMCALASLVLCGDAASATFVETTAILSPEMFFQADHSILFNAIVSVARRTGRIDAMLLREDLTNRQVMDEVGGVDYLAAILSSVPYASHGPHYARVVHEKWQRRRLIEIGTDVLRQCYAPTESGDPTQDIGQAAQSRIAKVIASGAAGDTERAADVLARLIANLDKGEPGSVPTSIRDFDALTNGIGFGEMMILGARPSMGKSAIQKQIGYLAALAGHPTLLVSQEESKEKILRNLCSFITGIDNNKIRRNSLSGAEREQVADVYAAIERLPLFINDKARHIRDVRAAVASEVSRNGIRLVGIDYLQRINGPGANRYEVVTNVSQSVSDMIKELGVAGLVLAQLSRSNTRRDDKRPAMDDLRESGQIEQDADGIVFLHREDYYHLDDPNYEPTGIAELIVAKWRDGLRNKVIRLKSDLRHQAFRDLDEPDPFGDRARMAREADEAGL